MIKQNEEFEKTAYDFLELAYSANTDKMALKYAKKAIELEPDNIDARSMVIELSNNSLEKLIEKYKALIVESEAILKKQGFFNNDNIGEFWLIFETRPYMRLLHKYSTLLVDCGQMRLAMAEFKKMLELCSNDNLGVRYNLMHLYAFFEDEQSALELFKTYPEDSTQFLLPLSILYYKLGNLRKSYQYLKKLLAVNEDICDFLNIIISGELEKFYDYTNSYGYRPFTIEELAIEYEENNFLFDSTPAYFIWAKHKINSNKK